MTTAITTSEADRYLKEVAPHLAALPAEERAELLEDLAQHLAEIAAEPGPPLEERLGPPEAYAVELLASAGVEATRPPRAAGLLTVASKAGSRLRRSAVGREVIRMWPSLRPAWWVARGYVAVYLVRELEREGAPHGFPIPNLLGNPLVGLVAVALAVAGSIRLGQRSASGTAPRVAVAVANGILVLYALSLAASITPGDVRYIDTGQQTLMTDGCLRNSNGQLITNLYAYDPEGRLLDPALIYDQNGQPLDNLCPEFDEQGRRLTTEYRRDVNGAPVINAFPRKQSASASAYPDGGPRRPDMTVPQTTVPVTPPAVVVPRLVPTTTTPTSVP